jgi:heme oxygenase (mycobilin-producing)
VVRQRSGVIVAISRFRAEGDHADRIADRFRSRSRRVDLHQGFLGLEVLRSKSEFLLLTRWETRDALKSYLRSEDFRAVHAQGETEQAEFATYEVVAR